MRLIALAPATIAASLSPSAISIAAGQHAAESTIVSQQIPLLPLISAVAQQAHQRIWILPGTPNPTVGGALVGTTPSESLSRLIALNGCVGHVHNGVMLIGTPMSIDARFGSFTTHRALIPVVGMTAAAARDAIAPTLPPCALVLIDTTHNALYVQGTNEALAEVRDALAPLSQQADVPTRMPLLHGVSVEQALSEIKDVAPPVPPESVVGDARTGSLLVTGPSGYRSQVAAALALIDVKRGAVSYNVIIAEADPTQFNVDRGVTLGQAQTQFQAVGFQAVGQVAPPTAGQVIFGFPLQTSLALELNALEQHGSAHFLRQQQLVIDDGASDTTSFVTQIPYPNIDQLTGVESFQTIPVGLRIKLSPHMEGDRVTTDATVSYDSIGGTGAGGLPIVVSRNNATRVTTDFGKSFLLSGLYVDDGSDTKSGVPGIDRIPVIGGLFTRTQKLANQQELVVIVSARVADDTAQSFDPKAYPHIPQLLKQLPQTSPSPAPHF